MRPFFSLRSEVLDGDISLFGDRRWMGHLESRFGPVFAFSSIDSSSSTDSWVAPVTDPQPTEVERASLLAAEAAVPISMAWEHQAVAQLGATMHDAGPVAGEIQFSLPDDTGAPSADIQYISGLHTGHAWVAADLDAVGGQAVEVLRGLGAWRLEDMLGFVESTGALGFALGFSLAGSNGESAGPVQGLGGFAAAAAGFGGSEAWHGASPAFLEPVLESAVPAGASAVEAGSDGDIDHIAALSAFAGPNGHVFQDVANPISHLISGGVLLDDQSFAAALSSLLGGAGQTGVDIASARAVAFDITDLLSGASPDGAALGYLDWGSPTQAIDQMSVHASAMNDHEMASSVMAIHDEAHRVAMLAA